MQKRQLTAVVVIAALGAIAIAVAVIRDKETIPVGSPSAQSLGQDTLDRIKASGTIVIGQRQDSVPFSYYDDGQQQVIGYSQDLAQKIIEAVKTELKLPELKVKRVPVSSQNRFALVQDGSIDLECGSTGHSAEREKLVAYSNSFFVVRMRLMTRKDYGIDDFDDLAGKTVVTTAGTTNVGLIEKMNAEKKLGMTILALEDHHAAFLALENKRAVAFLMDDVLLNGERIRAIRWGDWIITGTPQSREAYGCVLHKNAPAFKKVVDRALATAMTSGEAAKLYQKWFMSPIPPNGINLNFPMSSDIAELFKNPNDRVLDAIE